MAASLAIHMVVFMQISGIYRSNALSYIELTMQDISKPFTRSIPRPRHRPKATDLPKDIRQLKITSRPIPRLKPVNLDPVEKTLPDSLVEGLSVPDVSATAGLDIAEWDPGAYSGAFGNFDSRRSYFEMVRLNIERHKEYPDMARLSHIEGQVTVRFTISLDGSIREARLVKTSTHRALDAAALKAVQNASPFPIPPRRLFKEDITLELTIFFELT
ncbi:MAG: energy transducer TonB [Proteobacteria bacterium]|nr:energy transducer TonB [Pseudomonadota bacterium]